MNKGIFAEVHHYWFGPLAGPLDYPKEKSDLWFVQRAETDKAIRERFGAYLTPSAKVDWDVSALDREEQVGLIVLLDQFPRNIFRDSGESFAFDGLVRFYARQLLDSGAAYFLIERLFLFLPFEHSEDIRDQEKSITLFTHLEAEAPEAQKTIYHGHLSYAEEHRAIILRFGRFPSRNAALGRYSTPDERGFVAENMRGRLGSA